MGVPRDGAAGCQDAASPPAGKPSERSAPTNLGSPREVWGEDQTHCFWLGRWKHSVFSPGPLLCSICRKVLFLLQEGKCSLPSPNFLQNTDSGFYWLSLHALNRAGLQHVCGLSWTWEETWSAYDTAQLTRVSSPRVSMTRKRFYELPQLRSQLNLQIPSP